MRNNPSTVQPNWASNLRIRTLQPWCGYMTRKATSLRCAAPLCCCFKYSQIFNTRRMPAECKIFFKTKNHHRKATSISNGAWLDHYIVEAHSAIFLQLFADIFLMNSFAWLKCDTEMRCGSNQRHCAYKCFLFIQGSIRTFGENGRLQCWPALVPKSIFSHAITRERSCP